MESLFILLCFPTRWKPREEEEEEEDVVDGLALAAAVESRAINRDAKPTQPLIRAHDTR